MGVAGGDRRGVGARPCRPGSRHRGPVHHGRRDHLVGGCARYRRRRRAAAPRSARSRLQRRVPAPDQPCLRAVRAPARGVCRREDDERGADVPRRDTGVLHRAAGRARRPRAPGCAPRGGRALARVHGHRHDGERLLPALPRRRARAPRRARTSDGAVGRPPARAGRARVRDPSAGGRPRPGRPPRAARARDLRTARPALDDLSIPLAVRHRRGARRRTAGRPARVRTVAAGPARCLLPRR